ncbi:MAG: helix-turn-helix domain-containing protein [Vicingaceae bacterium]|nr:helix-turn-helix domain-containing protein [Vicingaceae bacterium]
MGKYSLNKTPIDVLYDLASKVKVLRKEYALTQPELAKRSGVSIGSLRRFEQTGQISLASLLKILNILGRLSDMEEILKSNKKENIENLFSDKTRK